jgi:alkaline phosphatase
LQYDTAFGLVMEFAKNDGNTIVISTSDHETGGLALGLQTDFAPDAYPVYAYDPNIILACAASTENMVRIVQFHAW